MNTHDLEIVREISIDAPIRRVFEAVTDPDRLIEWWGSGDSYRCTHMERDLRVGGAWRTTGVGRDGTAFATYGEYLIVEPPHTVAFTWHYDWEPSAAPTTVRYDLSERNGVTTLRVTHRGFTESAAREEHDAGWGMVLAWLRAYAERPSS